MDTVGQGLPEKCLIEWVPINSVATYISLLSLLPSSSL